MLTNRALHAANSFSLWLIHIGKVTVIIIELSSTHILTANVPSTACFCFEAVSFFFLSCVTQLLIDSQS